MQKTCAISGTKFEVTDDDLRFYDRISPVINGKKFLVPPPSLSPDERHRRRLSWRNERSLYRRKCDLSGKSIISAYSPDKPYTVYEHKEYESDKWDAFEYGRAFDFNRPFFEQYSELLVDMPKQNLFITDDMENCDYCNYGGASKDCYLCFCPFGSEQCLYSWTPGWCREDVDGYANISCQHCYETICSENSFELRFSSHSKSCSNSFFLEDCIGCENCFGCINLQHKKHCFLTEQLSEEEYGSRVKSIRESYTGLRKFEKMFRDFASREPHKCVRNFQSENCTGDLLRECRNCTECYDFIDIDHCSYSFLGGSKSHSLYDTDVIGVGAVECYEHIGSIGCNRSIAGIYVSRNMETHYSFATRNSEHCFGCDGLRRKKYCVLNKQYSKEEYEKLLPKIIEHMMKTGEWGEFFPLELSPFAYNESVAQEFFPLTKEEVVKHGWKWKEQEDPDFSGITKVIPAETLPDTIENVPDDVLSWSIQCSESKRYFRLQRSELEFYRKMSLPLPHLHPDMRYERRMKRKNPWKLWNRNCDQCGTLMKTTYAPERSKIVYCEKCYLETVY